MDPKISDHMYDTGASFVIRPLITTNGNGTWTARYPAADWSVTGSTEADARQRLHDGALARMPADHGAPWKVAAIHAHLEHGPILGVYELTREQNARVDSSTDPESELNVIIAEIEATRSSQQ